MNALAPELSPAGQEALALAEAGIAVFPCRADKAPHVAEGFKAATRDAGQIATWWRKWPDALIGAPTSAENGFAVLDCDVDKTTGECVGEASVAALGLAPLLTGAPTVRTPSGGRHYYIRHPGPAVRRRIKVAPGLDLLAEGGYVILGGSPGYTLEWLGLREVAPESLPDPAPIRARLTEPRPARATSAGAPHHAPNRPLALGTAGAAWAEKALAEELARVASAPEGQRNHTLNAAAFALGQIAAAGHLDEADVRKRLAAAGAACGLPPDEVARTVESGLAAGMQHPRGPAPREDGRGAAFETGGRDPAERGGAKTQPTGGTSEHDLALAFTERHRDGWRYDNTADAWMRCDPRSGLWHRCEDRAVTDIFRALAVELTADLPERTKNRMCARGFLSGAMGLAAADAAHRTTSRSWDADPMMLGTPGGPVCLKSGRLLPADPGLHLTKATAVAPDFAAACPTWEAFLAFVTKGDADLADYLHRFVGYRLTGSTKDHVVHFVFGPGGNGKSIFLNTIAWLLGEYARTAPMSTFTATQFEGHPAEIAMLRGARLVTASETAEGGTWNEARLKALSGGDRIAACHLYGQWFEFNPEFKLLFVGNTRPSLRVVDDALRRRLRLVEFDRKPETPDPDLADRLRAEGPAILAWAIRGCRAWQEEGLAPPSAIRAVSADYLDGQDTFGGWLAEKCRTDRDAWAPAADLYASWCLWCDMVGEKPGTGKRFGERLQQRGFRADQRRFAGGKARGWRGLALAHV